MKETYKGHYWDNWQNLNMYCGLSNRTLSMSNFLILITLLWNVHILKKYTMRRVSQVSKLTLKIVQENTYILIDQWIDWLESRWWSKWNKIWTNDQPGKTGYRIFLHYPCNFSINWKIYQNKKVTKIKVLAVFFFLFLWYPLTDLLYFSIMPPGKNRLLVFFHQRKFLLF